MSDDAKIINELKMKVAKLEKAQRKTALFCGRLMVRIHQLDKNMANNLMVIFKAIKSPSEVDIDDCIKQINRAGVDMDQMDAGLDDILGPEQDGAGGSTLK